MSGLIHSPFFCSGGSQKSYVILMGGHAKCLLLMTRGEGGGQKSQKPAYVIHGCSLKDKNDCFVFDFFGSGLSEMDQT